MIPSTYIEFTSSVCKKSDFLSKVEAVIWRRTKEYPDWARRRCQKHGQEYLELIASEPSFEACVDLRNELAVMIQRWQKTPWEKLPPELPRLQLDLEQNKTRPEDASDWLDRCYVAGGYTKRDGRVRIDTTDRSVKCADCRHFLNEKEGIGDCDWIKTTRMADAVHGCALFSPQEPGMAP